MIIAKEETTDTPYKQEKG